MADFYIKRNDRYPSIQQTLLISDTAVRDLTGCTVKFIMWLKSTGAVKINASASVVAPTTGGVVRYDWAASDTDTAGRYDAEWEVTETTSGKIETFPNNCALPIYILEDGA